MLDWETLLTQSSRIIISVVGFGICGEEFSF